MILFVIGIIVVIAGVIAIIYGGVMDEDGVKVGGVIAVILALVLVIASIFSIVPTGYTGVLVTFGRVEDRQISAGLNVIAPWQQIVKMDNRTQKVDINASAFSSDIQQVDTKLSVNFCINVSTAHELYKTVGTKYFDNVMLPRIMENTKAVYSKYTAENLIANRDRLSDEIADLMRADMEPYGISVISLAIEDIDFTDAFTNAVEAKQVAAQNKLTAETEQARKTMEQNAQAERDVIAAKAEAERAVIAANAELEVVKIQAEAALYAGEKEAEMNKRISESLTPNLTDYYWIKQWNGELPSYYGGDNTPVIDLR